MVKAVVRRLQSKFQIPIEVVETAEDLSPEFIPHLPAEVYCDLTGKTCDTDDIRLIVVPLRFFHVWDQLDIADIDVVLRHEYGHHLTWEELTLEQMRDERFRCFIFDVILHSFPEQLTERARLAEYTYFRHRIPSELMASEAAGLTFSEVQRALNRSSGMSARNSFKHVNVDRLLSKPLDIDTSTLAIDDTYEAVMRFVNDIILDRTREGALHMTTFAEVLKMYLSSFQ